MLEIRGPAVNAERSFVADHAEFVKVIEPPRQGKKNREASTAHQGNNYGEAKNE